MGVKDEGTKVRTVVLTAAEVRGAQIAERGVHTAAGYMRERYPQRPTDEEFKQIAAGITRAALEAARLIEDPSMATDEQIDGVADSMAVAVVHAVIGKPSAAALN